MSDESSPTVLIADDHPMFREALVMAVQRSAPHAAILEADTVAGVLAAAREAHRLDVILLDLKMPDSTGFSGLAQVAGECPDSVILVVTATDAPDAAARAKDYGASGFVLKSAPLGQIGETIAQALAGDKDLLGETLMSTPAERDAMSARIASLTPAQLRVLLGLMHGRLNKQIAYEMGISEATVKAHMTSVFRKLNVRNRTQAVIAARALRIDEVEAV